jgi:anti-sigma regulatory factor (Ser/Thr protein kinase)
VSGGAVSEFTPPWVARVPDPGNSWPVADTCFCVSLTTVSSSPHTARHKARVVLREWGVSPDDTSTALLLISELVTNATKFGAMPGSPDPAEITLALWHLRGLLVIEVSDQSPSLPVQRPDDLDSESGRGLNLVGKLSGEWHYYVPRPGWKTVYCVLDLTEPASAGILNLTAGRRPNTPPGGGG